MGCRQSKNNIDQGVQRSHILMSCGAQDRKNDGKNSMKKEVPLAKMKEHVITKEDLCNNCDSFLIKEKLFTIKEEAESDDVDDDSDDDGSFYSVDIECCSFLELDLKHASEDESSSPKETIDQN